jgi:acyl carrier protein phosphodiesterase
MRDGSHLARIGRDAINMHRRVEELVDSRLHEERREKQKIAAQVDRSTHLDLLFQQAWAAACDEARAQFVRQQANEVVSPTHAHRYTDGRPAQEQERR